MNSKIKVFSINPVKKEGSSTLAFTAVEVNDFKISGIRIMTGKNGVFIKFPPANPWTNKDGEKIYPEIAYPVTKTLRDDISNAILEAFQAKRAA